MGKPEYKGPNYILGQTRVADCKHCKGPKGNFQGSAGKVNTRSIISKGPALTNKVRKRVATAVL